MKLFLCGVILMAANCVFAASYPVFVQCTPEGPVYDGTFSFPKLEDFAVVEVKYVPQGYGYYRIDWKLLEKAQQVTLNFNNLNYNVAAPKVAKIAISSDLGYAKGSIATIHKIMGIQEDVASDETAKAVSNYISSFGIEKLKAFIGFSVSSETFDFEMKNQYGVKAFYQTGLYAFFMPYLEFEKIFLPDGSLIWSSGLGGNSRCGVAIKR